MILVSRERSAVAGILGNLLLRGFADFPPPTLPALLAQQAPLQVDAQKPQPVCSRHAGARTEAGVESRQVLHSPWPRYSLVPGHADEIDEPEGCVQSGAGNLITR